MERHAEAAAPRRVIGGGGIKLSEPKCSWQREGGRAQAQAGIKAREGTCM